MFYKVFFESFLGDAEGEGVRGPVPEAGNQFLEGRTPSCPKSTLVLGQHSTPKALLTGAV